MIAAFLCNVLFLALLAPFTVVADHIIDDYGAIRNNATAYAASMNGISLFKALQAAAAGANGSRTAVVPHGGEYYYLPFAAFDGISNVQLTLDGALLAYVSPFPLCIFVTRWQVHRRSGQRVAWLRQRPARMPDCSSV